MSPAPGGAQVFLRSSVKFYVLVSPHLLGGTMENRRAMSCLYPRVAFDTHRVNPDTGKRVLTFKAPRDLLSFGAVDEVFVPCGKCEGCLADKRREWINRLRLEHFDCQSSTFITLTYDNNHVPSSLRKSDLQKFLKRFRHASRDYGVTPFSMRYFACGEYGSLTYRPHYHAIIFGVDMLNDFSWKPYLCGVTNGRPRYSSSVLETIWGKGFVVVGSVTDSSVRYVAKYVSKENHCPDCFTQPPFFLHSQGLGRNLFVVHRVKQRKHDFRLTSTFYQLYESGLVAIPSDVGFSMIPIPKVIDDYAERFEPSLFASVKAKRKHFLQHRQFQDVAPRVRSDSLARQKREQSKKGELDNE